MLWIVDDDPDEMFLLTRALRRLAPQQAYATFIDPQDALDQVAQISSPEQMPRLVVSDLNMPGWDGVEFFQQLEHSCTTRALPNPALVLITGVIPSNIAERTHGLQRLLGVEVKSGLPQELAQTLLRFLETGT